jgi:hypothetical protein
MVPDDDHGAALSASGRARLWQVTEAAELEDEYGLTTPVVDGYVNDEVITGGIGLDLRLAARNTRFSVVAAAGCAIRASDKALVFLPTLAAHYTGEVNVRVGPPGEFQAIVECRLESNASLPTFGQIVGHALMSDGKLVTFDERTTTPHASLTQRYVQVQMAHDFICGIVERTGRLDCDGRFWNINPPMDVVFKSLASEHRTAAGSGRMYGITPTLDIHYWGDGGGVAMMPPPGFPFR